MVRRVACVFSVWAIPALNAGSIPSRGMLATGRFPWVQQEGGQLDAPTQLLKPGPTDTPCRVPADLRG